MAASPRSTVSSDLYCLSEQAQPKVDPKGGRFREDANQLSCNNADDHAQASRYFDTIQGLDSAGEDASEPSRAAAGPTTNGASPKPNHKRKRNQDSGRAKATEDHINNGKNMEMQPLPGRSSSYRFMDGTLSLCQGNRGPHDPSGAKRSKINGPFQVAIQSTAVPCNVAALPAALWQYIFCFVPPVFLGHLLSVNRTFKSYLTPGNGNQSLAILGHSIVQPLTAEAIWVASRRQFAPGLPRPIHGLQELDMWRLLIGKRCQRCGHVGEVVSAAPSENPWESGPGASGVRVIWPFGVRCCGSCLHHISMKVPRDTTLVCHITCDVD